MSQKIAGWIVILLGLLAPVMTIAAQDTAARKISHHGTLYRIRYEGKTAWLFGTIHIGTPGVDPLEGAARAALAASDELVLEIDIDNTTAMRAAVMKHAFYPSGDSISRHLSPPVLARLRKMLTHEGIPYESVAAMKPWFTADLLMLATLERHGYSSTRATEVFLAAAAKTEEKSIGQLETADFQLSLFDNLSQAEQEQYLQETLDEIDSGKMVRETRELFDAWAKPDDAALNALLKKLSDDKTLTSEFTRREILDKRNPPMTAKIEVMMKKNRKIFVGVGLLHLLGKQGLPALLQRRGYEVQKIY